MPRPVKLVRRDVMEKVIEMKDNGTTLFSIVDLGIPHIIRKIGTAEELIKNYTITQPPLTRLIRFYETYNDNEEALGVIFPKWLVDPIQTQDPFTAVYRGLWLSPAVVWKYNE